LNFFLAAGFFCIFPSRIGLPFAGVCRQPRATVPSFAFTLGVTSGVAIMYPSGTHEARGCAPIRLQLEVLENRDTPTGNVLVGLAGTQLSMFADDLPNAISLTQDATGRVTIQGFNGTLINGQPFLDLGVVDLSRVDSAFQGGADVVVVQGLHPSQVLGVNLGSGNDTVSLTNVFASQLVSIGGGAGFDTVIGRGIVQTGDLVVETGNGPAHIDLAGVDLRSSMTLITHEGNDFVSVQSASVLGPLLVDTGAGNDQVVLNAMTAGTARVLSASGHDSFYLINFHSLLDVGITTADGDDFVWLFGTRVDRNLLANVESGPDTVRVTNLVVGFVASFNGGSGFDTFIDEGLFTAFIDFHNFDRIFF
jgi:hypothetical protein